MLEEVGEVGEVMLAGMLDDEERAGMEEFRTEDFLRDFSEAGKVVWGIGENDVE